MSKRERFIHFFFRGRGGASSEVLCEHPVLLGQPVDAVVRLPHAADGAADGVGLDGAGHAPGGLVHVRDVDLDGGVVLGGDDAVARRAEREKRKKL